MPDGTRTQMARLDRWLAARLPDAHARLGPPGPADAGEQVRATGCAAPTDLLELWALVDGAERWLGGVDDLLSVERAVATKAMWDEIIAESDDPDDDYHSAMSTIDPDRVDALYWSPAWIPFTVDGGGNGLTVDTAPLPGGTHGQVVTYGPDRDTVAVLAPSLSALLGRIADAADAGEVRVVDGAAMLDDGDAPNFVLEALYGLRLREAFPR